MEIVVLVVAASILVGFLAAVVVAQVRQLGGVATAGIWASTLLVTASAVAIVFVTTGPQW